MNFVAIRDWVYDNYQLSYVIGTGALCLGALMCHKKKRYGAALAGYAAVLAAGALLEPCVNISSQQYGPCLSRGNLNKRVIAFTFDDGPNPEFTPLVLDVLAKENVKASFFCVGDQALRYPDLVKRIDAEGHLVGTHSYSHKNLLFATPSQSRIEINAGCQAIYKVLGKKPVWFRPPYGMRYPWTLLQAREAGLSSVLWSNCPRDWQCPGYRTIARRIFESALPGDIVLLHDSGGDRIQTVKALGLVIRLLRLHGYSFVRVDEL